ncbi:MAG: cobalt-precorrin-6A reductase [Rhodobacteraceae bacterium]|nr:cobalt-precorrin-6A reductase [Paracoccaceae bacterium]
MRLLLMAGSGEARRIAGALTNLPGVEASASLAGATRRPAQLGLPTRIGGFGGRGGFIDYLRAEAIEAVLDATHPFAANITARTAAVCHEMNLPHAVVMRPEWRPGPRDRWRIFDREDQVAGFIPKGATVFLGTGVKGLEGFSNLRGRQVICRRIDQPKNPFPFRGGEYLIGRPPFSQKDEVELFGRLGVDWLVVKNAGGDPGRSKLLAARQLGIKVAMMRRPPEPQATILRSVKQALTWVQGQT